VDGKKGVKQHGRF
jgi:hypothetical protein